MVTARHIDDARAWAITLPVGNGTESREFTLRLPAHSREAAWELAGQVFGKLLFGTGWYHLAGGEQVDISDEPTYDDLRAQLAEARADAAQSRRIVAAMLAAGRGFAAVDPEVFQQVDPDAVRVEYPPAGQHGPALFYLDGVGPEEILAGMFADSGGIPAGADGPDGPVDMSELADLGRRAFGVDPEEGSRG